MQERAKAAKRRALFDGPALSSEVKATLRACPELMAFGQDIHGPGVGLGLDDVLGRVAAERYYFRHPLQDDHPLSSEVKATLRVCPELTAFKRDIPGEGAFQIGLAEFLSLGEVERFYERHTTTEDD